MIVFRIERLQRQRPRLLDSSEGDDDELSILNYLADGDALRDYARRKCEENEQRDRPRARSTVSTEKFIEILNIFYDCHNYFIIARHRNRMADCLIITWNSHGCVSR